MTPRKRPPVPKPTRNLANAVERVHHGLAFDVGGGETFEVFHPDLIKQGDVVRDERLMVNLTYVQPELEIKEDGSKVASPGRFVDVEGNLVRYDTDPSSLDRRNFFWLMMKDSTMLYSCDADLPPGARKLGKQDMERMGLKV